MRNGLMIAPLALGAVLAIGGVAAPAQAVAGVGSGSAAAPAGGRHGLLVGLERQVHGGDLVRLRPVQGVGEVQQRGGGLRR